jgi:hypothetical protein
MRNRMQHPKGKIQRYMRKKYSLNLNTFHMKYNNLNLYILERSNISLFQLNFTWNSQMPGTSLQVVNRFKMHLNIAKWLKIFVTFERKSCVLVNPCTIPRSDQITLFRVYERPHATLVLTATNYNQFLFQFCVSALMWYWHITRQWLSVIIYALNLNSVSLVHERIIPAERQPLVGKVTANVCDRGCHVVSVMDPYGRTLGLLDRSRYFFFQVAPQLHSRGWVDPVPNPLLLRKSGSAENRTRTSGSVAKNH